MRRKIINTVEDIEKKRTGGQSALMGYDYQLLYSCYIALNFLDKDSKVMKLEGIEDIDTYRAIINDSVIIEHIQLKYSKDKQDANFLDNILNNFLEVYLIDKKNCNRYFKLVYDMTVSKGNLSKLIDGKLDSKSKEYWNVKIRKIQSENSDWDWVNFNYEDFYKQLRFEGLSKKDIVIKIERLIIGKFNIDTGSEKLFLNALFYNIFHKAQSRGEIRYIELLNIIQNTKDYIAKGFQNPAYSWIDKIDFDRLSNEKIDEDYFEGKKAAPQHIAHKLPVRRITLEKIVEDSINSNVITIIKSSSGQGKTTLTLQVAYNLKDEYTIYKVNWCRDSKELGNITEYFNSRLKLGEKILIFFDNLNNDLKEWNKLAQVLYEKLLLNYKILLTTRQDDWYLYSGDQTNLYGLKIIDIYMNIHDAEDIYNKFKEKNKIHESIKSWQPAWEKVANRQLLIEYVYLLTHGEMLEERIGNQIKLLSQSIDGNIKLELLRLVAFSDIIGMKIRGDKLIKYLSTNMSASQDINEIIRSIENEYFIKIKDENIYIEGLHPVRSQHLVDKLHLYQPISDTIKKLVDIIEDFYIGQLFSQIPVYLNDDKEEFYKWLVTRIQDKSYDYMVKTIQGIFSGYVLKYFKQNITIFDDADKHSGLFFFLTEINPWNDIKRTGTEVKILQELKKIQPENPNINYLLNLTDTIPKLKVAESDIYIYCYYLTQSILNIPVKIVITGLGILSNWLTRIDNNFKILNKLAIENVWSKSDQFNLEELSILLYEYYKSESNFYQQFVNSNKEQIFSFLKIKTDSVCIYEKDLSIYIKYILLPSDIKNKNANEHSVERINMVCRFLPIYSEYCADAIRPKFEFLENLTQGMPDESHKTIPIRNVKLLFNVDLMKLWQNSILSHYEFDSVYDWQKYWSDIRIQIVEFMKLNIELLECGLKHQRISDILSKAIEKIKSEVLYSLMKERLFPYQNRPFNEPSKSGLLASKIKTGYFSSIQNYMCQFFNILLKDNKDNLQNKAVFNLKDAKNNLAVMQDCYNQICENSIRYFNASEIEKEEFIWINRLINLNDYYIEHIGKQTSYSRQDLKEWVKSNELEFMRLIYNCIAKIQANYDLKLIVPQNIIKDRNLITIVIGVENFDISDSEQCSKLLYNFIPFAEINFDFLIFVFINKEGLTYPRGSRVRRDTLIQLKKVVIDGDESIDNITNPFPIEITQDYLDSLGDNLFKLYKVSSGNISDDFYLFIMLLWKYSQYKINLNLSMQQESDYLKDVKEYIEKELDETAKKFNKQKNLEFFDELLQLKNDVLTDDILFTDNDLNFWFNKIFEICGKEEISTFLLPQYKEC